MASKGTILVGTVGQGIMMSGDDGNSWTRISVRNGMHTDGIVRTIDAGVPTAPGLTFYGAPIAGAFAFVAACRGFGQSPRRIADVAIPGVPIAHALGRLGCFFAGCCYGRPSDGRFAVLFPPSSVASVKPGACWPSFSSTTPAFSKRSRCAAAS